LKTSLPAYNSRLAMSGVLAYSRVALASSEGGLLNAAVIAQQPIDYIHYHLNNN
jgi:hypothetical protein